MAEQMLIDMQWVEVMPPVTPEPVSVWIWIISAVLLLAITAITWWFWQRQPRQRALRQLRDCEKQLHDTTAQPKKVASQMYRALQTAMSQMPTRQVQQLDPAWPDYYRRLAQCVFHAQQPDSAEVQLLLHETRNWVRRGWR